MTRSHCARKSNGVESKEGHMEVLAERIWQGDTILEDIGLYIGTRYGKKRLITRGRRAVASSSRPMVIMCHQLASKFINECVPRYNRILATERSVRFKEVDLECTTCQGRGLERISQSTYRRCKCIFRSRPRSIQVEQIPLFGPAKSVYQGGENEMR